MKVDRRKRQIIFPERSDLMIAEDVLAALLDFHGRSTKRVSLDFSQTEDVDTAIYQLVISASKSFDTVKLIGLDDKPFAARMQQWVEGK